MKTKDIRKLFENTNGKIFSVKFVKANGEVRQMQVRTSVTKHLKGGKSTLEGKENLMVVYSMDAKGYRCINLDTVISAKIAGVEMMFNKELENV